MESNVGMSGPARTTCAAFDGLTGLAQGAVHQFIVGLDSEPRVMMPDEAAATLRDTFATSVLLKTEPPKNAEKTLEAIARIDGNPLPIQQVFVLGEGSQIPFVEAPAIRRGIRFLIACRRQGHDPDIIVSAFRPTVGAVELMAWDHVSGGFNFYRTVDDLGTWAFAGNSSHALADPTQGRGPFESHMSGNLLMKELKAPWVNWDSPDASIESTALEPNDPLRNHPWFVNKEKDGALTCELTVLRPSVMRWTNRRFEQMGQAGSTFDPARVLVQILTSPAVNLVSSPQRADVPDTDMIDLPASFFVDVDGLVGTLKIGAAPAFQVQRPLYNSALRTFDARLFDRAAFSRPRDTHFAFVVPERAFEDQEVLAKSIPSGLISERLAACLLMTDFPNPIFSGPRSRLMSLCSRLPTQGLSSLTTVIVDTLLKAADQPDAQPAEVEFATRWGQAQGEGWQGRFGQVLEGYYSSIRSKLLTQDGFDAIFGLAESRRALVRDMPIFENPLMFATTNDSGVPRSMRIDASVRVEGESPER